MNYIKLTRLDGTPIWISMAFIVTIEPRKGCGSIVVPIGDGLDYDVKESPEDVLAQLQDFPTPQVVPVPAPKGLAPTHETIASDVPEERVEMVEEVPQVEEKPAKKTTRRKTKAAKEMSTEESSKSMEATKESTEEAPKPKAKARTRRTKKPPLPLDEAQLGRLLSAPPRSVLKLKNALASQFKIIDLDGAIAALEANKILSLDGEKITWSQPK